MATIDRKFGNGRQSKGKGLVTKCQICSLRGTKKCNSTCKHFSKRPNE